jgi:hypothetical protein
MFHDNQFGHGSNINVTTATISEAAVLIVMMGGINEVHRCMASSGLKLGMYIRNLKCAVPSTLVEWNPCVCQVFLAL